ncbi:MAG: MutS-related protein, partial [bacterium]
NSLVELLWDETLQPSHYGYLLNLLAVIPLILIGSYYFIGITSLLLLILMTVINVTVIHFFKKKHFNKLPIFSIKYLSSLIKTADNINSIENPILQEYQKELKPLLKKTRKLSKKISIIIPKTVRSDADLIFDYLNNLFLIEIRSFNSSLYDIKENIKELKKIYRLVGKIDSLLSIASYRESLTYYCLPEFVKGREDRELEIEDVYHPLLKKPVSNSIKLNNTGVIITGSNMAGKSTFLRTIGINVLMAQTISTCLAGSYKSSMMKVVTSISKTDNILEGKSFYFAEAERLLKLVNSIKGDFPALCIIDELLSGTNSVERLYASEGILDYLFKNNVLTMVATHDLDLADRLKDRYDCYHFNDNVSKYGLDFDYILKRGNALTFNAIKLLEYLNYPEEITDRARIKKSY